MTYRLLDGVQQTVTGNGTGTLILGQITSAHYRSLTTAGLVVGDTTRVRIDHPNFVEQWEVVLITLNADGTIIRTFDAISFSATGALINFADGNKIISSVVITADVFSKEAGAALFAAVAAVEGIVGDVQAAQDSAFQAQAAQLDADASALSARLSQAQYFPIDFVEGSKYWTYLQGQAGTPQVAANNPLVGSFPVVASEGIVFQTEATPQTCASFGPIGYVPAVPGTVFQMRVRVRAMTDNTGGTPVASGLSILPLDASFNYTSFIPGAGFAHTTVADGWQELQYSFTVPPAPGLIAYYRPSFFFNTVGATTDPLHGSSLPQGNQQFQISWFRIVVAVPSITPLPLQSARRCLLMGDSITENCNTKNTATLPWPTLMNAHQNDSWFSWANRLCGQRMYLDPALNMGIGGDRTDQMLARFNNDVMANLALFDIMFLMAGTNDTIQGIAPAVALADIQTMANAVLAKGKQVIVITPPPAGSASFASTPNRLKLYCLCTMLREWAKTAAGVTLVDPFRALSDPTSGINGFAYAPLFFGDGIHPSGGGAYRIGQKVADAISVILPPGPDTVGTAADLFDTGNNPLGNRIINGCFTTVSGGTLHNGSGTLASGFTVDKMAGSWVNTEVVFSVIATTQGINAIPGNKQHIVVNIATGKTTNERFQITNSPQVTTFLPGDKVIAEIEMDISGMSNMWYAQLGIIDSDGLQFQVNCQDGQDPYGTSGAQLNKWDPQTYTNLVFRTPIYTVQKGVQLFIQVVFAFDGTTGATATIDLKGATLRKVA